MLRWFTLFAVATMAGCLPALKEEQIEVKPSNDPLSAPRAVLERYARGEQVGSEVTSFPKLIEDVKAVDAARGAALEKGLAEIQKSPGSRATKAKELLKKLAPSMMPGS